MTIDAGSMAIGFVSGLIFYIAVAIIAALVLARKWKNSEDIMHFEEQYGGRNIQEKYYAEDIFE